MLDIKHITAVSVARSEHPKGFDHPIDAWSVLEWAGACAGEIGEATNIAKKMSRFDKGFSVAHARAGASREELKAKMAKEMGDGFHYMVLWAHSEGLDLEQIIRDVFNEKSDEIGYPGKI